MRFSKAYPVVLLARQPASYEGAVAEINNDGKSQRAVGVSADASDPGSLNTAFETIAREFPAADGWRLAAAIYNVGGGFGRGPFLDVGVDALDASFAANAYVRALVGPPLLHLYSFLPPTAFFSTACYYSLG